MKTKQISNYFGSNRMLAENVGTALEGKKFVGIPCAGGMSELAHIGANVLLVSDLNRHVINLAQCIRDDREELVAHLEQTPFHPDELQEAQKRCLDREKAFRESVSTPGEMGNVSWAIDYFLVSWLSRAGTAGTKREFQGGMSIRWKSGGGDSAVRFRSATESLTEWQKIMRRCTFVCQDAFAFLAEALERDDETSGIYADPPFPGPGDAYKCSLGLNGQERLAESLGRFTKTRVVARFYDVPLIRQLYPESMWTWNHYTGRKQTNNSAPEVLLVRN